MSIRALYAAVSAVFYTCVCLVATAQASDEIQSALTARVSFTDLHGTPLDSVSRDKPFTITVAIDNAIGNEPPAGLYLNGWLRQQSQRNLDLSLIHISEPTRPY